MKRLFSMVLCLMLFAALLPGDLASAAGAEISIGGLQDGKRYYAPFLTHVEVSSPAGGAAAAVYGDGVLLEKQDACPAVFDLSGLSSGGRRLKAVVYDGAGLVLGEKEISITVMAVSLESYISCKFDDLQEGIYEDAYEFTESQGRLIGRNEAGYYGVKAIDPDHGKSLMVGIETAQKDAGGAWIGAGGKDVSSGIVIYSGDVYIDTKANYEIYLRGSTGAITNVDIRFTAGGMITFGGVTGGGIQQVPYEEQRWYSIRYVIDMTNKTYSFSLDGIPLVLSADMANPGYDIVNSIRLVAPNKTTYPTFMALDNVNVDIATVMPYISGMGYDSQDYASPISYEASYLNVNWSQGVNPGGLTPDTVALSQDNYVEEVVCSGQTMRIKLKNRLLSNTRYEVIIAAGTELVAGMPIAEPVRASFTTGKAPLEIVPDTGAVEGGSFRCQVENTTGQERAVYAMEAVWNGTVLKGVNCTKIMVSPGAAALVEVRITSGTGEKSEFFLLDGFDQASVISNQIFTNID